MKNVQKITSFCTKSLFGYVISITFARGIKTNSKYFINNKYKKLCLILKQK